MSAPEDDDRPFRVGLRQPALQIHRRKAANGIPLPGSGQSAVRTHDPEPPFKLAHVNDCFQTGTALRNRVAAHERHVRRGCDDEHDEGEFRNLVEPVGSCSA